MDFTELSSLISIKEYISFAVNNSNIPRKQANELNNIMILVDKKIVEKLTGPEFKEYVGFSGVKQAVDEAVQLNNIKSAFIKER